MTEPPGRQPAPAIRLEHLGYTYPGAGAPTLVDISLSVRAGERLGILGPNGGGKSTLLKLLLALLSGATGTIEIFGRSPLQARRERLLGYVPQRSEARTHFPLTVRQVASMGALAPLKPWQRPGEALHADVERSLQAVGADSYAHRPISTLSGGQLQRTFIARALAARPRILLLDEPTVGVDVAGQRQFAQLLDSLHQGFHSSGQPLTILVVSHDIRAIAAGSDTIACLSRTLHSHTAPAGLTPQVLAEVFRHDVAAIFGDVHVDAHPARGCPDPTHHH